jgi:formylglycine-generating enzyme required for sulfatase activity
MPLPIVGVVVRRRGISRALAVVFALSGLPFTSLAQVEIVKIVRTGNDAAIEFKGTAGTSYQVEKSDSLASGSWTAVGSPVAANGANQTIPLPGEAAATRRFFRLVPQVAGFRYIPEGGFRMGDQSGPPPQDGSPNERPVIELQVAGFFMKETEVTKDEWDAVKAYGLANGYTFSSNSGQAKGGSHPVHTVTWYDVVRWCNAKSEQDGREPCYLAGGVTYKTGIPASVTWVTTRNGYRLPCEAEWEKAARGGLTGQRFPGGATLSHGLANYRSTAAYAYDTSANDVSAVALWKICGLVWKIGGFRGRPAILPG